ncbi:ras suppressor protein 1 [Limosa lapponica baueri]|uniref:Ras suppressor protein 1 n=1 Tax=Limosa lapponica baueri TaxID=1758121 RepID=A0A2I0T1T5_LIMLA|nr:ras suppressor protein 1 [Limosa lapponica baueri]
MNRLNTLPRGFGSLPALEVLDLTYNNLNENSLPGNFFYLTTLRALYLSDNDFEILPPDIGKLTKLQIVSNLSKFLENQFTFAMLVGIESSQFEE